MKEKRDIVQSAKLDVNSIKIKLHTKLKSADEQIKQARIVPRRLRIEARSYQIRLKYLMKREDCLTKIVASSRVKKNKALKRTRKLDQIAKTTINMSTKRLTKLKTATDTIDELEAELSLHKQEIHKLNLTLNTIQSDQPLEEYKNKERKE